MTKMKQVGRTSPSSQGLTQAGHVVIAIQEGKCYPMSFPALGVRRHSLPGVLLPLPRLLGWGGETALHRSWWDCG